jgi:hypothetical protein
MSDASPSGHPQAVAGKRASLNGDLPDQLTDRFVSAVDTVHDKTTVPITMVGRAVVFGVLAGVLAAAAGILLIIAGVRLHVYWPFHPAARQLWVTYAILGGIFLIAGLFCWAKRSPRGERK